MAAKKKSPTKSKPVAVDAEAALLTLTQEEILRLRLLDAQARLSEQEARLGGMERAAFLARVDPQKVLEALDQRIYQSRAAEAEHRKDYKAVLEAASKRLGINLSVGCTINPETGKIIQHTKQE